MTLSLLLRAAIASSLATLCFNATVWSCTVSDILSTMDSFDSIYDTFEQSEELTIAYTDMHYIQQVRMYKMLHILTCIKRAVQLERVKSVFSFERGAASLSSCTMHHSHNCSRGRDMRLMYRCSSRYLGIYYLYLYIYICI